MLDLKFIEADGTRLGGGIWPQSDSAAGLYSLIQKIVLCMITEPGDDIFDPEFGGGLRSAVRGIAGQETERAKTAVATVLARVSSLLKTPTDDPEEQLIDLRLRSVTFDMGTLSWLVEVDVITAANQTTITVS